MSFAKGGKRKISMCRFIKNWRSSHYYYADKINEAEKNVCHSWRSSVSYAVNFSCVQFPVPELVKNEYKQS